MKTIFEKINKFIPRGVLCLLIIATFAGYLAMRMGITNAINTTIYTAHDLLLNTVFYLMAVCVLTGALGHIFIEFGVVALLEKLLKPLMKPIFNLPGVASIGAILTFLSDNPAIISLAHDKRFASYFKKYQFISLTNFGTAFGMGLLVIVYMFGQNYFVEPLIGFVGAMFGCMISTRLMQYYVKKAYPSYVDEEVYVEDQTNDSNETAPKKEQKTDKSLFLRILDAMLDGGRTGVDVGVAIIPGVLIISTFVMITTFGPGENGAYTGAAYQGIELLPAIGDKFGFIFEWLFGFKDSHLIAFPITALGAVGAALGLIPQFIKNGWIDGNAIAVYTAIGMCWSGYLSTHTAMLDSLGFRQLTSKAILAHTIGGLCAAVLSHWFYLLYNLLKTSF